jgi:hypothetical protein
LKRGLYFSVVALCWFWLATLPAAARSTICAVCGKPIDGQYYQTQDLVDFTQKDICVDCQKLQNRCFACGLPVLDATSTALPDGRYLCAHDAAAAVFGEDEAKAVCQATRDDLDRLFARFITFPNTNALVSIVNKFYLENLFKSPNEGQACVSLYGATTSNRLPGNRIVHSIAILSHLRKSRLQAVCAHEFTHAWMGENVTQERTAALDKNTLEAFCELVSYKYMVSLNETNEMTTILKNDYTKGKIDILIAADNRFGFDAVVEWIKSGDDTTLDADHLERIRAIGGNYVSPLAAVTAAPLALPTAAYAPPAPTTLVLKSISGAATHRFALINSTTFETMEQERVRVGATNYVVRCLEIGNDSVTIQVNGSPEKKRLTLADN